MMALAADRLRCLGASVEAVDVGSQKVRAGALPPPDEPLPPHASAVTSRGGSCRAGLAYVLGQSAPQSRCPARTTSWS